MKEDLAGKKCVPCEGGTKPLTAEETAQYLTQVSGWEIAEGCKIQKRMKFKNFVELMKFVNRLSILAESEGHHPDFFVSYNQLTVTLWTHAINGLSENDFIVAKKIDHLMKLGSDLRV